MKKLAKKILVYVLYFSGLNFLCGLFLKNKLFVLIYHSVSDEKNKVATSPELFEKEMAYLKRKRHNFLRASDVMTLKEKKVRKPTIIYFDDGFKDNLTNALPILKKYDIRATIFVTTGYMGKENKYLNWDEVLFLKKNGFEVGSHTVNHKRLAEAGLKEAEFEISESKKIIENKIGDDVCSFSFPKGSFNDNVKDLIAKSGYKIAVSDGVGLNDVEDIKNSGLTVLKNVDIRNWENLIFFKVKLYSWNCVKKFL